MTYRFARTAIILCLGIFSALGHSADLTFEAVNLPEAQKAMISDGKPLVIYVSHSTCPFCKRLEKDVMPVVLNTEYYKSAITLQKLQWDSSVPVVWLNNKTVMPEELVAYYRVRATPTILFVNQNGEEIAEKIEGYRDADFYWFYFDKAISQAQQALNKALNKETAQ